DIQPSPLVFGRNSAHITTLQFRRHRYEEVPFVGRRNVGPARRAAAQRDASSVKRQNRLPERRAAAAGAELLLVPRRDGAAVGPASRPPTERAARRRLRTRDRARQERRQQVDQTPGG